MDQKQSYNNNNNQHHQQSHQRNVYLSYQNSQNQSIYQVYSKNNKNNTESDDQDYQESQNSSNQHNYKSQRKSSKSNNRKQEKPQQKEQNQQRHSKRKRQLQENVSRQDRVQEEKSKIKRQQSYIDQNADYTDVEERRNHQKIRKCQSKLSQRREKSFEKADSDQEKQKQERKKPKSQEKYLKNGAQKKKIQKKQKQNKISSFDRIEELRFQQHELKEMLGKLNQIIQENSQNEEDDQDYFSGNFLFTVPQEAWEEIKVIAKRTEENFQGIIEDQDKILEDLNQELQKQKQKYLKLKSEVKFLKNSQINNSQISSNYNSTYQNEQWQKSIKNIMKCYERNVMTQMVNQQAELELFAHGMKNTLGIMNVHHLGNLSNVEKEIEEACNFMSKSGRIIQSKILQSARDNNYGDKNTPRGLAQKAPSGQLSKRGNSKSRIGDKVSIPPLPMHMLQKDNMNINSNRGNYSQRQQMRQGQMSSRRQGIVSAGRNNQIISQRQNSSRVSAQGGQSQRQSTYRSGSQIHCPEGGVINGYLVNPIMLQAVPYQTSRFDKALEDDYEGANQTLDFRTDRLKPYEEEYEFLMQMDDDDNRILMKQHFFNIYEKDIKKQMKQERKEKRKLIQKAQQLDCTTPRQHQQISNATHNENDQTIKEPTLEKHRNFGTSNNESGYQNFVDVSMEAPLSPFGTNQIVIQNDDTLQEAKLTQLLAFKEDIDLGMKSATCKSLIQKIEQDFQLKEQLKKENRKVLDWECEDDEDSAEELKEFGEQKLYNNNAISIIDNKDQNENSINNTETNIEQNSPQIVYQSAKRSNKSPKQSYRQIEQSNAKLYNNIIIEQDEPALKHHKSFFDYEVQQQKVKENNQKIHSNRSKSRQDFQSLDVGNFNLMNNEIKQKGKVQSARGTPSSQQIKNGQNYQKQINDNNILNQNKKQNYIHSKLNLLSAPNSQRNSIQINKKKSKNQFNNNNISNMNFCDNSDSRDLLLDKNSLSINNFYSIQVEDYENNEDLKQNKKSNRISQYNNKLNNQYNYNNLNNKNIYQNEQQQHNKQLISERNHYILNKFDEQNNSNISLLQNTNSSFDKQKFIINNDEPFFLDTIIEGVPQKTLIKSGSEILLRDSQRMYDINDFIKHNNVNIINNNNDNIHQVDRINFYFGAQNTNETTSNEQLQNNQLFNNESLLVPSQILPSRQQNNIYSSMKTENMQNADFLSQPQTNIYNLLNIPQAERSQIGTGQNDLIMNYFNQYHQQTQGNYMFPTGTNQIGIQTNKKRTNNTRESGSVAFSLTASSEDTFLYQFLTSHKKTFQILQLQNHYNNFYHNQQAGVLFTMNATKDMNNEFLGNCSTVPSEPLFIGGTDNNFIRKPTSKIGNKTNTNNMVAALGPQSMTRIGMLSTTDESGSRILNFQKNRLGGKVNTNNLTSEQQLIANQKMQLDSGLNIKKFLQNNNFTKANQFNAINQNMATASTILNQNLIGSNTRMKTPNLKLSQKPQDSSNNLINSQISKSSSIRTGGSFIMKKQQQQQQLSDNYCLSPQNFEKGSSIQLFQKNQKITAQQNNSFSMMQQQQLPQQNVVIKKQNIKRILNNQLMKVSESANDSMNQDINSSMIYNNTNNLSYNNIQQFSSNKKNDSLVNSRVFSMAQKRGFNAQSEMNYQSEIKQRGTPNENMNINF